jgi:hypothetical protein
MERTRTGLDNLEKSIRHAFRVFDTNTFSGQFCEILAGEYAGFETFAALAEDSHDHAERTFWILARDIEARMISRLEHFSRKFLLPMPNKAIFFALGRNTCETFSGTGHADYCAWVAPLLEKALIDFSRFGTTCGDVEGRLIAQELVFHELAFIDAWKLMADGWEKSASPLANYLEKSQNV